MKVFISGRAETEALKNALREYAFNVRGEEQVIAIKILMRVIQCEELQDQNCQKKTANRKGQR